jgi:uncharacterized protein (DUF4415 family)
VYIYWMKIRYAPKAPEKPVEPAPEIIAKNAKNSAKPSRKGIGGRPKVDDPAIAVTIRIPRSCLERWQRDPDWRAQMTQKLKETAP